MKFDRSTIWFQPTVTAVRNFTGFCRKSPTYSVWWWWWGRIWGLQWHSVSRIQKSQTFPTRNVSVLSLEQEEHELGLYAFLGIATPDQSVWHVARANTTNGHTVDVTVSKNLVQITALLLSQVWRRGNMYHFLSIFSVFCLLRGKGKLMKVCRKKKDRKAQRNEWICYINGELWKKKFFFWVVIQLSSREVWNSSLLGPL